MRLYHDIYWKILYFCSQELWLLMDAYFRICDIIATRVRKLLIQRYCWFWGSEVSPVINRSTYKRPLQDKCLWRPFFVWTNFNSSFETKLSLSCCTLQRYNGQRYVWEIRWFKVYEEMAGMEAEADRCSSLFCQYIRRTVDRTGCCSLSLSATIVFQYP